MKASKFKCIYPTLFLLLLSFSFAKAQEHKLEIGINAGPNMSTLVGDYYPIGNSSPLVSLTYGVRAQLNFSDRFALVANITVEKKGTNEENAEFYNFQGYTREDVNIKYNYLTLPILARFTFGDRGKPKFFLNAGPYFAILTSAKMEFNDSIVDLKDFGTIYNGVFSYRNIPIMDVGIAIGAGVKIPVGDMIFLSFEIRNNLGLVNVAPADDYYNSGPPLPFANGAVNNSTCFLFGFSIGI